MQIFIIHSEILVYTLIHLCRGNYLFWSQITSTKLRSLLVVHDDLDALGSSFENALGSSFENECASWY